MNIDDFIEDCIEDSQHLDTLTPEDKYQIMHVVNTKLMRLAQ